MSQVREALLALADDWAANTTYREGTDVLVAVSTLAREGELADGDAVPVMIAVAKFVEGSITREDLARELDQMLVA